MRTFLSLIVAVSLMAFTLPAHAQTFSDELSELQSNPSSWVQVRDAIKLASNVDEVNQVKAVVDSSLSDNIHATKWVVRGIAKHSSISDALNYEHFSQKSHTKTLVSRAALLGFTPNSYDALEGLTHHFHVSNRYWDRLLQESVDDRWIAAFMSTPSNLDHAKQAKEAFDRNIHNVVLQLRVQGKVTDEEARSWFNEMYMILWSEYLSQEDQTTSYATAVEKHATTAKSLRDMLSE